MQENYKIIDKLYLNPIIEGNSHRKILHPIKQRELSKKTLVSSRSVGDLFTALNGNVIMQNWNTKTNIPNDIGEYINLPVIIDRKKLKNLNNLNTNSLKKTSSSKKNEF